MSNFDIRRLYVSRTCTLLFYAYNVAGVAVPFAFVTFSINRLCLIVYHAKPFFKKKRWLIICIVCQWIGEFIISLPSIFRKEPYCNTELWGRIYTCMMAVFVPSFINIMLNIAIFIRVRSATRRVQPRTNNTSENSNRIQQARISPREIFLLRQMIFIFLTFIIGWTPVYIVNIINPILHIHPIISQLSILLCEVSLLSIIINLFMWNHELRQYFFNKIRHCFVYI
ncbi:unnamed protein product [Rotaria sordida]|uniref:G-protein coupled receptors family 1 profile domain-containing protein n=1 Tax=Rotaria sordida TaxID=392033 RepID=A0A819HS77_9BILA|nr:unnamed protein product [Rotaria sordida]CAF1322491.1 unnamed protein product [Rotaria sordida]CAF1549594.1 unnamed protein product [Rotaria sordida]CAF3906834.1 unnamed protein product [Rotaria sordida]